MFVCWVCSASVWITQACSTDMDGFLSVHLPLHIRYNLYMCMCSMWVCVDVCECLQAAVLFFFSECVCRKHWASQLKLACACSWNLHVHMLTSYAHSNTHTQTVTQSLTHRPLPILFFFQPFFLTLSSPMFYRKVFMCLISFSTCRLLVSGRCGVSSSWDCRTMSLFSLQICSSTHHAAASGSTLVDWSCGPGHLT